MTAELAKDHYLLHLEREQWEKGQKVSKPELRYVPINDFISYQDDRFFEKHGYTVEILHDPRQKEGAEMTASTGGKKTKKDLVETLAKLIDVDPSTIDNKLTVKELEALIEENKK